MLFLCYHQKRTRSDESMKEFNTCPEGMCRIMCAHSLIRTYTSPPPTPTPENGPAPEGACNQHSTIILIAESGCRAYMALTFIALVHFFGFRSVH